MKVHISAYDQTTDQRVVSVEVEPHDLWNVDTTLAAVIFPVLKRFRETTHSFAEVDDDDLKYADEEVRKPLDTVDLDERHARFQQRWYAVLDVMVFAFDFINRQWEIEEAFYARNPTLVEHEAFMAEKDKVQFGLNMFAKHYRSLWD